MPDHARPLLLCGQNPENKEAAESKFVEVAEAFEVLSGKGAAHPLVASPWHCTVMTCPPRFECIAL